MHKITLIPGDGIGPEISAAVREIFAVAGVPVQWDVCLAGQAALREEGDPLPEATLASIRTNRVALKGPLTTQIGSGYRSINVSLRQKFTLFCNLRPVKSLPGVDSRYHNIDLVIFRENTEDLYAGIECQPDGETAEATKRITRKASLRIAEAAFAYAVKNGRSKVTAVHKANIMKLTDGLFLQCAREVAARYPRIKYDEVIIDNLCMQLVMRPEQFDVLLASNLYGDIISDLCAGLVGGLGLVPGANIGADCAIFEAVHGTAPDIAGQNKANPLAMLLSGLMMLVYLGEQEKASRIQTAVERVLQEGNVRTADLGGCATTAELTREIIKHLK